MPLYHFLLVIVSLACGSLPPSDLPLASVLASVVAMLVGWGLLCHIAARLVSTYVLGGQCEALTGAQLLERQLDVFRWLGLGVSVLCLAGFGLGRVLHRIPMVEHSMLLQAICLLAPGTLLLASTWSAEHLYGVRLGYTRAGWRGYFNAITGSFRQGAGWLLLPMIGLASLVDLIGWLPIHENYRSVVVVVGVLVLLVVGIPSAIRILFPTSPFLEEDRLWIRRVLMEAGLGRTRVLCWNTKGRTFNALLAGVLPPLRTILVSDRMVREMPRNELAMVLLHEVAHARRFHVAIRLVSLLPAWGAAAIVSYLLRDLAWGMPLGTSVGVLLTVLIIRAVALRTELDADWTACRLATSIEGRVEGVPSGLHVAGESLYAALQRITKDHPASADATWLHPSVAERIAFVREKIQRIKKSPTEAMSLANSV